MKNYKLIAMDLDGTLTQHKSKLNEKNTAVLQRLAALYSLVIVGAGSCLRIWEQMNRFDITIIGNYGMQRSHVEAGNLVLDKNDSYVADRVFFEETVARLRKSTGYTDYVGDSVEFHPSGAVTFPLIGTKALLSDKLAFDPKGIKRTLIYEEVAEAFKDYNCFIGGSSSFDIVNKCYDKYKALIQYADDNGFNKEEILFIGDDFKKGGNDEQVMTGGIDCICIQDYTELEQLLIQKGVLQ